MPPRPHVPAPPAPRPHARVSTSDILSFIQRDEIDALLRPLVPDAGERSLVLRALLDVGPAHHRGANYVLLRLLGLVLKRQHKQAAPPQPADAVCIPLRLPPHLASGADEAQFPLRLPTRVLELLAKEGSRELVAMADCLIDGPPQHSLANAMMLALLEALLLDGAPEARQLDGEPEARP